LKRNLANQLAHYYYTSNINYEIKTKVDLEIGDIVLITDTILGLYNYGRVIEVKIMEKFADAFAGCCCGRARRDVCDFIRSIKV
jgi:hypothetical protein